MLKLSMVLVSGLAVALWLPVSVWAASSNVIPGLDEAAGRASLNTTLVGNSASQTVASRSGEIIGNILAFLGIIFLVLMIFGGLKWMTSAGDPKSVGTAKSIIGTAAIGLLIVLSAYAAVTYLGNYFLK